jgi:hypothetical protein
MAMLSRCTQKKKNKRGELMQPRTETLADHLVGGKQFSAKISRQKQDTDHNPAQQISENNLQKSPVTREGQAGDADDGKRARLGRHDRERNRPPRKLAIGEEVTFQRTVRAAKPQAKQGDPNEINPNQRQINRA